MRRAWTIPALAIACLLPALIAAGAAAAAQPRESAIEGRAEDDGRVSLRPVRFDDVEAVPGGEPLRFTLTVKNTHDAPVTLLPRVIPLDGSTDPALFAVPGGPKSRSFTATEWASFPGFGDSRELGPGRTLDFDVLVDVPIDATPGSYALGLGVAQNVSALGVDNQVTPAARVDLDGIVASVAVVDVPGETQSRARFESTSGPRLVWGGEHPTFKATVENVGDTTLLVDGQVALDAFLGTAGRTLPASGPEQGYETLPGGVRDLRMRWSDPPLIGWFQPQLVVVGGEGSGVRITKSLDTVYVLPPWWLILLLVAAIWLPVRTVRRRRRAGRGRKVDRARAVRRVEERQRKAEAKRRAEEARRKR